MRIATNLELLPIPHGWVATIQVAGGEQCYSFGHFAWLWWFAFLTASFLDDVPVS
jgi:hypothetical protein